LIGSRRHIDDFSDVRMKSLQCSARRFSIEGTGRYVLYFEIIKQSPRNRRLAHPSFICADHNYDASPYSYSSANPLVVGYHVHLKTHMAVRHCVSIWAILSRAREAAAGVGGGGLAPLWPSASPDRNAGTLRSRS
jgi:hypothetical protein